MNRSQWVKATLAAAITAGGLITLTTQAAERGLGERPWRGQIRERVKEKLGLTDEQVAQIKTELQGQKETLKELISRLHTARVSLREAIQARDATETSVRAASAKVAVVEADLAVERLKLRNKITPILTAEQRDKLREFQGRIDDFLERAINRFGERLGGE